MLIMYLDLIKSTMDVLIFICCSHLLQILCFLCPTKDLKHLSNISNHNSNIWTWPLKHQIWRYQNKYYKTYLEVSWTNEVFFLVSREACMKCPLSYLIVVEGSVELSMLLKSLTLFVFTTTIYLNWYYTQSKCKLITKSLSKTQLCIIKYWTCLLKKATWIISYRTELSY